MCIENKQMTIFNNPAHFMGAKLDPEDRWIKISQMIPRDEIEEKYKENFSKEMGKPAKLVRMAFGSNFIKEEFCLPDEETVELIATRACNTSWDLSNSSQRHHLKPA